MQVRRALCRVARRVQVQWLAGIGLASRERPRCAGAAAKVDRPEERAKGGPRLNLGWWAWALACSGVEWRADASTRPVSGGEPGRDMRFGQKWAAAVTKEAYVDEWSGLIWA